MFGKTRAPELTGRGWLNTGGKSLSLSDLRGKIVLLDFWTFCCINCLHVIDALRDLEKRYDDVLVTIGVHSPKFEHEKDATALAAAVERYGVRHPVLDDPEMTTWRAYAARAWPTLAVVDPEGYVVASVAGEGHEAGLSSLFDELIAKHSAKGTLRRGDGPYVPPVEPESALRFPGKALVTPNNTLLVTSSAQHQIVEIGSDGETIVRRIGSGKRGLVDGKPDMARFSEPQGMCWLPPDVAAEVGYDIVVADTVNHTLRGLRYEDGTVKTIAGTGRQLGAVEREREANAHNNDLSSPWDVAWFQNMVVIAMAGVHQLWWFDPKSDSVGVYAGNGAESLRDGEMRDSSFAQPSGLSVSGDRMWIADSETSALRWTDGSYVHTAVGQGLFDFGLMDGAGSTALMQHPLGVLARADGSVLVADTYNGAIRRYDVADDQLTTMVTGLAEPSDIVETASGDIVVVESAAHRVMTIDDSASSAVDASRMRVERPPTVLGRGEVTLDVLFTPPAGQKLDDSFGSPTQLTISASPPSLLVEGAGGSDELSRRLVIAEGVNGGVLEVDVRAATCDVDSEHAACHLVTQSWGIPLQIDTNGPSRLELMFRGVSDGD
jgi:thiol-disulfide isomerase/thioredoxin